MSQSTAFQVVLAVKELLTIPAMAAVDANDVHIDPIFPADVANGAALNIELGDDVSPDRSVIGMKDRATELKLTAIATGTDATLSADAVIFEANARLMADESLGGLCDELSELGVSRFNEANGKRLAVIEKTYLVKYRTSENTI